MKRGEFYQHPSRMDWGIGEVLDINESKVSFNFEHAGLKTLDVSKVRLDKVERTEPVTFRINIAQLETLCQRFFAAQEHNRRGSNDGRMAQKVLDEVKRRGLLTESTKKQLLAWCYTDGNAFQSGVALAREICFVVYGRLLPDPDKT